MTPAFRVSASPLLLMAALLGAFTARSSALQTTTDPSQIVLRVGFARPGGGYAIESIPLETYVGRVLAGEAARGSTPAALEALAITIRTYALGNRDRHRADGFDLCDETHCQVVRTASTATARAAEATAGLILMRDGLVATVFYGASCGGRTEIPSNVWPGADDPPYLPSVHDEACEGAPEWEASLGDAELLRAFRAAGYRGDRLRGMRVTQRNSSGRVARLRLDGLTPAEISGQDLRVVVGRTLGWQHIKSAAFELSQNGRRYVFRGNGFGHGVGLCVIGSTNLAAQGVSATAILAKYFPGAEIAPAGPRLAPDAPRIGPETPSVVRGAAPVAGVALSLPDDDAGARAAIARMVAAVRDELAGAIGVPPPSVVLRVHTTSDDYERATGRSWFTSGTWQEGELHLMPLAALRERGVLEQIVRHEMAHAMIDHELAGRPAWVREGAALYFAGIPSGSGDDAEASTRPVIRAACPDDNDLLYPLSAGALSNAYARARSCFTRQLDAGREWREVR